MKRNKCRAKAAVKPEEILNGLNLGYANNAGKKNEWTWDTF